MQLFGGIQRYLEQFPDGGFFKGKNFVFDHRYDVLISISNYFTGIIILLSCKDWLMGQTFGIGVIFLARLFASQYMRRFAFGF